MTLTQLSFEKNIAKNQQEFTEGKLILESRPTFAWLAFTGRCNLNCAHCARRLRSFRALPETPDLTPELFGKLKTQLLPWLTRYQLGGNNLGEQLYAPNFDEYFDDMQQYPGRPVIQTSGMLLNTERIEALAASGAQINLSLEGATPGTYNSVRGRNLDELIEFARYLDVERKRLDSKATIKLTFTSFYDNIRELPDLVTICKDTGVDMLVVTHLLPLHEGQRYQSLVYHQSMANEMYDKSERLAAELGVKIATPHRFKIKPLHKSPEPMEVGLFNPKTIPVGKERGAANGNGLKASVPVAAGVMANSNEAPANDNGISANGNGATANGNGNKQVGNGHAKSNQIKIIGPGRSTSKSMPICTHPWTSVSIDEMGDVHPCCASGMVMGNLNENTLEEIWNNGRYQKMRATVNTPHPAFTDCRYCVLRGVDMENDFGGDLLCGEPKVLLAHIDVANAGLVFAVMKRVQKALLAHPVGKRFYPLARRIHHRIFN
ncbi:MAG: radical SAM/SPASM domain-containing protein [Chloroflexi bacterium]|nr:radical SAM/SPASM domain-containing protein [Chloroflexota bacterium]